jgi:hypothetical protein
MHGIHDMRQLNNDAQTYKPACLLITAETSMWVQMPFSLAVYVVQPLWLVYCIAIYKTREFQG